MPLSKFSVVTTNGVTALILVADGVRASAGTVETLLSLLHWLQDKAIMKIEKVNNGLNCFIVLVLDKSNKYARTIRLILSKLLYCKVNSAWKTFLYIWVQTDTYGQSR